MAKQKFVSQEGKLEKLGTPDTSGGEAMVSYMKALPFDHIIGAPLMACIKAQQASAQWIEQHGTEDTPEAQALRERIGELFLRAEGTMN